MAVSRATADGQHIWVKPLDDGPASRLTFSGIVHLRSTWTPDGESLLFVSDRTGAGALYRKRADGSAAAEQLRWYDDRPVFGVEVSRDGRWIVFRTDNQAPGRGDILAFEVGGDTVPRVLVATPGEDMSPTLSPDGRFLAYSSDESRRREVYVIPFPNVDATVWQVSTGGGTEPLWSNSGRELFYRDFDDNLVAVQIVRDPTFSVGVQRPLFSAKDYQSSVSHRSYDVTPDDQRFLMIKPEQGNGEGEFILVLNAFEELKAKVGN